MSTTTFTAVQDTANPGIAMFVQAVGQVTGSVHCVFTDHVHNSAVELDKVLITKATMNAATDAGEGVMIYLSDAQYETLSNGSKVILTITSIGCTKLVKQQLTYKQVIPFEIVSVLDGLEQADVTLQLDLNIHDQNKDGFAIDVSVSQDGIVLESDFGLFNALSNIVVPETALVKFSIGVPGTANALPNGEYEIGFTVSNDIGSVSKSVIVIVTSTPSSVQATSFNTFAEPSGALFQLEYGPKNYSNYTNLKVMASFSQKDNSSVPSASILVADICGATFNTIDTDAPVEWLMPANIKSALNALNVSGAYDAEKFEVQFWIEGNADLTDDDVVNPRKHVGAKSSSEFWLDTKLNTPTLSLHDIDWTSGEQIIEVVEDGSFNNYAVYYDLSGSNGSASNAEMNDASGSSGATMEAKAEISYTYSQLLPNAAGEYKSLYVRVERPEINNLDAINPPMNKSDSADISYLKAVKRAAAPEVVDFTPLTVDHDGSIEFAYIEASANTDLFGYLQNGVDVSGRPIVLDSLAVSIPAPDASNAVISFDHDLSSGTKYVMNAYSRFDLSSFNVKYRTLNETKKSEAGVVGEFNDNYLLSAKTSDSNFFTEPPTFSLTVRPTGDTNKLSTVRMHGESKGNNIKKMMVFVKDVCGQVLESEVLVEVGQTDTCGNVILNTGGHVDNFNTSFIQDFVFDEPVSIGIDGGMFLLGIIDTPNEVDAIDYDQSANPLTTALNTAINQYDAGVVAYNTAVDASNNYGTDVSYVEFDDELNGWTLSAESLIDVLRDTCANILGAEDIAYSDLNVAALLALSNATIQDSSGMLQTASSMNAAITQWALDVSGAATLAAAAGLKSHPTLTYTVFTASGETAFAQSAAEINVPTQGYSTINLANTYNDYVDLVTAQQAIQDTAHVEWNLARVANEALKAKVVILNGDASVAGSIKEAEAGMVNSAAAITQLFADFASAIFNTRSALVGYNASSNPKWGTYHAGSAKDGSLARAMNDARQALSDAMDGIEKYREE